MDDRLRRRLDTETWLEYAERDLVVARRMREAPVVEEAALFHCQQAAEKALKAYLILAEAAEVPRTHSLRYLVRMLDELGAATPAADGIDFLDVYGVSVRYPGIPRPDAETVETALLHTVRVVDFVHAQLELRDRAHEQADNNTEPGSDHVAD